MALGYVRPALPGDAAEITRIQLSTWRTAYRRLLPRQVLDELDEDWIAGRWREAIEEPPSPAHRVLVAVEQSAQSYLVGFAAAGPVDEAALAPDESPAAFGTDTAAITELLVEPRWGRRGHGSRLLAACVDGWRSDGFTRALAWAYERDVAAVTFLRSAGWAPDGASRALDVDDLLVTQVRLHADLTGEADPAAGPATPPSGEPLPDSSEPLPDSGEPLPDSGEPLPGSGEPDDHLDTDG